VLQCYRFSPHHHKSPTGGSSLPPSPLRKAFTTGSNWVSKWALLCSLPVKGATPPSQAAKSPAGRLQLIQSIFRNQIILPNQLYKKRLSKSLWKITYLPGVRPNLYGSRDQPIAEARCRNQRNGRGPALTPAAQAHKHAWSLFLYPR